jgi:exodeoxyribonuclease-3
LCYPRTMNQSSLRIASWNVNGLRAASRDGQFRRWLDGAGVDIAVLQEVRAQPEQLPADVRSPEGWHTAFHPAERPGYSGVALYARRPPDQTRLQLGQPHLDCEGRLVWAQFGRLHVIGGYFPNGNGKDRDLSRIPYKLEFYRTLQAQLQPLADAGEPVIVLGDWNTAQHAIDLARPKQNAETSGFRPEEREEAARWISAGWTDSFRHFHPTKEGAYSWWSNRPGVRDKNIGWRIDYALVSPGAMPYLRDSGIAHDVRGSDHCPVWLDVDAAVMG